jgi:hypothetical protein
MAAPAVWVEHSEIPSDGLMVDPLMAPTQVRMESGQFATFPSSFTREKRSVWWDETVPARAHC